MKIAAKGMKIVKTLGETVELTEAEYAVYKKSDIARKMVRSRFKQVFEGKEPPFPDWIAPNGEHAINIQRFLIRGILVPQQTMDVPFVKDYIDAFKNFATGKSMAFDNHFTLKDK